MSFTQRPAVVMEGVCRSPVQQEKEWREGVRTPGLLWSYSGPELSGTPAGVHSGALRPGVLTPLRGCVRMDLLRSGARRLRPNFAPARRKKREGSGQGSGPGAHAQKGSEGLSPERFPEPEPV